MSADSIHLVPYDERWPELAAKEMALIRAALPELNFEIEHIGSTAVPGLSAKPILDLLVGVDSLGVAQQFIAPLEKIGYSYWRENPKSWHFYFVKGLPLTGGAGRTHHVHLYEKNHHDFRNKLLFRNYLRTHPETAKTYLELKFDLANKYAHDREKYTEAKTEFIRAVIAAAESETKETSDSHYINPKLAQLYDLDSGWSAEREFYLSLAGDSPKKILDLGCGTGLICNALAEKGHEVTGADPSAAMLDVARQKPNGSKIEWILSTAQNFKSDKIFDLIIMSGNAFQVFLDETDLQAAFKVMQTHLKPDGMIAFESRNPNLDWVTKWNYEIALNTPVGKVIESRRFLKWTNSQMSFDLLYQFPDEKLISHSKLRFWSPKEIEEHTSEAGLRVERLMGDWDMGDFKKDSTEEMVFFVRHPEVKFVAIEEEHISILRKWLKEPHVAEFWQETDNEQEFRAKFLSKLQDRGVSPFIVYLGRKPIGYIQSYEAQKVGGGWWPDSEPGTFGIDQFIGDPDFINRGWGAKIIRAFIDQLYRSHSVREVITDPEPKNIRAIRCYEKVGFARIGLIKTPGGDAELMRLTR